MKRQTLNQFLTKNITYTLFIPIILITIFLSSAYYMMLNYVSTENKKSILNNAKKSLQYSIERESNIVTNKMKSISDSHKNIYTQVDHFYKNRDKYTVLDKTAKYEKDKFGLYYQTEDKGGADSMSFLFTKLKKEEIIDYLNVTQWFDISLKNAVEANDEVVAAWIIDSNAMIRYYPFIGLHNYLSDLSNFFDWSFYYEADLKHNPSKKPLWSSTYLDPAGNGWMTSYISPIYDDADNFRGVVGLDVPIKELAKDILVKKIPFNGEIFLTDNKGMIIAITDKLNLFFELVKLKKNEKGELVIHQTLKPIEHNLLKHQNKNISKQFKDYFEKNVKSGEFVYKGKTFLVENKDISNTNWKVFFLIDKDRIIAESLKIQENSNKISSYIFIIVVILLLMLLIFLYKHSKRLSIKLSNPIIKLSKNTENINNYKAQKKVNIQEIDNLLNNFDTMVETVQEHIHNLDDKVAERTKELKLLASIDPMTKLFNRRYFAEMSISLLELARRNKTNISTIMLDIDRFKDINDTYGHQVGDDVIITLASVLQEQNRKSDVISRWGGEEFVILLPNTHLDGAFVIAEKIRTMVENLIINLHDNKKLSFTVSMGISQINNEEDIDISISISKADKALYEAKESGRNKTCINKL